MVARTSGSLFDVRYVNSIISLSLVADIRYKRGNYCSNELIGEESNDCEF